MGIPLTFTVQGIQGGDWLVLGRLLREDATTHNMIPVVPADVISITRYLVDLQDGKNLLYTDTLTVSTTILAALSTGNVWNLDTVGFNFRDQIAGARLAEVLGVESQYSVLMADGTIVKLHIDLDLKNSN
jgi:hypothetical protein